MAAFQAEKQVQQGALPEMLERRAMAMVCWVFEVSNDAPLPQPAQLICRQPQLVSQHLLALRAKHGRGFVDHGGG